MYVAGLATFGQMSIFLAMLKNEQSSLDYNKCHMLIFLTNMKVIMLVVDSGGEEDEDGDDDDDGNCDVIVMVVVMVMKMIMVIVMVIAMTMMTRRVGTFTCPNRCKLRR